MKLLSHTVDTVSSDLLGCRPKICSEEIFPLRSQFFLSLFKLAFCCRSQFHSFLEGRKRMKGVERLGTVRAAATVLRNDVKFYDPRFLN